MVVKIINHTKIFHQELQKIHSIIIYLVHKIDLCEL